VADGTDGAPVLLGDIGGTNARFALLEHGGIGRSATLAVAEHPTALEAIGSYLRDLPKERQPRAAALACAGPPVNGAVAMTNSPWRVSGEEIRTHFGFHRVVLLNDFAAQAWAIRRLRAEDLRAIGGGNVRPGAPAVILGPGTGLGVATYLSRPDDPVVIVGEGGHATLPASNDKEAGVIAALRARFGHVSVERVLSGDGLVNLYRTLADFENEAAARRSAAEITDLARAGACADCKAALDMFCAMLGSLAGNLALTLGAQGGVYIAGGIAPRIADYLATSGFRAHFEAKGRFRSYLAAIPTWVVLHPSPAFLGLAEFWSRQSRA